MSLDCLRERPCAPCGYHSRVSDGSDCRTRFSSANCRHCVQDVSNLAWRLPKHCPVTFGVPRAGRGEAGCRLVCRSRLEPRLSFHDGQICVYIVNAGSGAYLITLPIGHDEEAPGGSSQRPTTARSHEALQLPATHQDPPYSTRSATDSHSVRSRERQSASLSVLLSRHPTICAGPWLTS